jgi:ABC-2 type transport system permease protein
MNFVMVPIFLLSGALFPLQELPRWVQTLCYANPLFYGVDGLRSSLIGVSVFPVTVDFAVLLLFCSAMVLLGAFLFSYLDVD